MQIVVNNQSYKFLNITKKHTTKKSHNSKFKENYYINKKTDLATEKKIVLCHTLKINNWGGPNKLRDVRKKTKKLISTLPHLLGT